MPINVMDVLYRSFLEEVVPVCHDLGAGPIGMKGLGGGYPEGKFVENNVLTADEAYRFCLSQPISSQVMGIRSMEQLKMNVQLCRNFQPMTAREQSALLARVYETATDGRFETFKSTNLHDGPHHRKQHGFAV